MAVLEYISRAQKRPAAPPRPPRPPKPPNEADERFREERANNERLKALEREVKLAQQRGELISREMVQRQSAFVMTSLRSRLLALPATLSRKLEVSDRHAAKLLIEREVKAALEELSDFTDRVTDDEWRASSRAS
jgi:hypothetical protein